MRHAELLSTTVAPAAARRGESSLDGGRGRAEGEVDAFEVRGGSVLDHDFCVFPREGRAGAAGGGEIAHVGDREFALGQDGAQDDADLSGGADDGDAHSLLRSGARAGALGRWHWGEL